ncbi:AlkA N-terminal domain-containing protein [Leucobacter salsicius]|uniref:AlkA N-terminal domain-containing protein n=1 Tax=Leucobacter salsicius TaxID=664638 RepID=UPI00034574AF|nr:AlkA N-terminal domain-containing protein [Leucobacter salsicius]
MNLDTDVREHHAPITLELEAAQPFDAYSVFDFLSARAIPGVESVARAERLESPLAPSGDEFETTLTYARTVRAPGGPAACEVTCARTSVGAGRSPEHSDWRISVAIEATEPHDVTHVAALISRVFDLNAESARIDADLARDPALAPLVQANPGVRVPGTVDPAELVMRAIIGQQITVAAARGHLTRLVERADPPVPLTTTAAFGLTTLFPTPTQIVATVPYIGPREELDPDRPLRLPRRQSNAVRAAAEALASGTLDARAGADPDTLATQLAAVPGIGPWTAAYIALRVLGDPDAWMLGDVALVAGARAIRILPSTREGSKQAEHRALAERAAQWAPWRSYASMHLWRAAAPPTEHKELSHAA